MHINMLIDWVKHINKKMLFPNKMYKYQKEILVKIDQISNRYSQVRVQWKQ